MASLVVVAGVGFLWLQSSSGSFHDGGITRSYAIRPRAAGVIVLSAGARQRGQQRPEQEAWRFIMDLAGLTKRRTARLADAEVVGSLPATRNEWA